MVHRDGKYEVQKIPETEMFHPEVRENPPFTKKVEL